MPEGGFPKRRTRTGLHPEGRGPFLVGTSTMISVEVSGCGLVREPQRSPVAVFIITVTRPQESWAVYRKHQSFKVRNVAGKCGKF